MKKNEFRVRKTFERPIKNIETFKTSIEEDYEKYVNNYWEAAARVMIIRKIKKHQCVLLHRFYQSYQLFVYF